MSVAPADFSNPRKLGLDITINTNTKNSEVEKLKEELEKQKNENANGELERLRAENEDLNRKIAELQENEDGKGGSGSMPLGQQANAEMHKPSDAKGKSYNSYEELITDVFRMKNSQNENERAYGESVIQQMWSNNLSTLKRSGQAVVMELEGGVKKYLDSQNQRLRQQMKESKNQ